VTPILVHDYLLVMRGAERCFMAMCDLYPGAPVATLLYDSEKFADRLGERQVLSSSLQRLGARQSSFRTLLPLLPAAAERLPVEGHRLVLSSSSAFAHGVQPDPEAVHVCYCYTPFRYAWYERERGVAQAPRPLRPLVGRCLSRISDWDFRMAQRNTHYVAISRISRERIRRYWGRDAPIVHPPVELDRFAPGKPEDYFLTVGELVRHKHVELALEAARQAGVPVKVVGSGPDEARLRATYSENVEYLGRVDDDGLAKLYARARAFVMPGVEEFGIAAVEAQAAGRPVIAINRGGAQETVVDGETGTLVPDGDASAMAAAMRSSFLEEFDPRAAIGNARRFSVSAFKQGIRDQVDLATEIATETSYDPMFSRAAAS
jgi:glycosyltransferase involved in cell wall biosynthesis